MIPPEKIAGRLGNKMFQLAYLFSQVQNKKIPDIFVQDPKYFEDCAEHVKKIFGEGIGFLPYVSIHLRVGTNPLNPDEPAYSENSFYVNLSKTDYYIKAIEMFPGKKFLVFSDNTEIAKEIFKDRDIFQIMEGGTDLEDFNQMASCESNIIANSSYSWWAAYLNPNWGKTVIAPSIDNWYSDKVERTVCPKEWKRI